MTNMKLPAVLYQNSVVRHPLSSYRPQVTFNNMSSPIEILPIEIQIQVLVSCTTIDDLKNLIDASPILRRTFYDNEIHIVKAIMYKMSPAVLEVASLADYLRVASMRNMRYQTKVWMLVNSPETRLQIQPANDLEMAMRMGAFHKRVQYLTKRIGKRFNRGPKDHPLSHMEIARIQRALYNLDIWANGFRWDCMSWGHSGHAKIRRRQAAEMYLRSLPVQVIEQMTSVEYMLAQDLTKKLEPAILEAKDTLITHHLLLGQHDPDTPWGVNLLKDGLAQVHNILAANEAWRQNWVAHQKPYIEKLLQAPTRTQREMREHSGHMHHRFLRQDWGTLEPDICKLKIGDPLAADFKPGWEKFIVDRLYDRLSDVITDQLDNTEPDLASLSQARVMGCFLWDTKRLGSSSFDEVVGMGEASIAHLPELTDVFYTISKKLLAHKYISAKLIEEGHCGHVDCKQLPPKLLKNMAVCSHVNYLIIGDERRDPDIPPLHAKLTKYIVTHKRQGCRKCEDNNAPEETTYKIALTSGIDISFEGDDPMLMWLEQALFNPTYIPIKLIEQNQNSASVPPGPVAEESGVSAGN